MYVLLLDVLFHGKKHQKQAPLLDLGGGNRLHTLPLPSENGTCDINAFL